jgi:RND superfamily putative drug exporter
MSHALHRFGRFAARRPWAVIGTWLLVSLLVITAAMSLGRELGDSFEVPGLDSQEATDLLSRTESDRAGLTAQVVATPVDDGVTFFDSKEAREDLAEAQTQVASLDNVVGSQPGRSPPVPRRRRAAARCHRTVASR